jgi:hypothetical protein
VLIQVYRGESDRVEHKKTAHYQKWCDTVAELMAEPHSSVKYTNVFPDDEGWGQLHPSRLDWDAEGDRFRCGGSGWWARGGLGVACYARPPGHWGLHAIPKEKAIGFLP